MTDVSAPTRPVARNRPVAPTRLSALIFGFKVNVFRLQRFATEVLRRPRRLATADATGFPVVLAESRTALWSDPLAAERGLQLGKVQNLRIAARLLDGINVPGSAIFSFWRQLGRPARSRGFVDGRMLQEGCMVPAVGGGLCQLSNALYDVALRAGCEIVERHAHSRIVPGSAGIVGRDATIAWNYVDLRFRSAREIQLRVFLTRDQLVVQLCGQSTGAARATTETEIATDKLGEAASCATCNETSCFRHEHACETPQRAKAFLLDEAWPEFAQYVAAEKQPEDRLAIPLDGARWGIARYAWDTRGFSGVSNAGLATLSRSFATRKLAAQGPARQLAQLQGAEMLAKRFAKSLTADITDICVAQSLLPFLWRDGHLGGRRYSVLMTRLPIRALQETLDRHAALHPERATLADFRAPDRVAEWESAALAAAETIVTPHTSIAALFGDRAVKLDWVQPKTAAVSLHTASRRIAFPGPTVARKGCYELREAARMLDLEIVLLGAEIEQPGFWSDVRTGHADPKNWLSDIAAVVQPALVEHSPRRLLAALAAGVPVIATPECGLDPQTGLTLVPAGDATALAEALKKSLD